jgi:hypothetical protein
VEQNCRWWKTACPSAGWKTARPFENNSWLPADRARPTPFFPPSGPPHRLFQGPPAKSKFLAASQPADFVAREFGSKPHRRIGFKWYWWETALVLAVLIALAIASLGDW